ncbi:MAG: hypothetical protein DRI61_16990 [Chloroflexi bacterium]|nr:MAG: hypothetical protein DRI61_16990 [Chloroflexota bacterium]
MSSPIVGYNAVVKKDTTEIGYAKGVTVGIDVDLIKEYALGSNTPSVLEAGNRSFPVSIEKMYVDNTYAQDVCNGTTVDIVVQPAGQGSGKPEITIGDVVFTSWELSVTQDGVVMESLEGEGKSITLSTQS